MSTCQSIMLTCQEKIITTSSLINILFLQGVIASNCHLLTYIVSIMSTCQINCCYLYGINWARTRFEDLFSNYDGIFLPSLVRYLCWLLKSLCRLFSSLYWLIRSLCWLVTYSFVRNLIIKTCSCPVNTIKITTKLSDNSTSVSDKLT